MVKAHQAEGEVSEANADKLAGLEKRLQKAIGDASIGTPVFDKGGDSHLNVRLTPKGNVHVDAGSMWQDESVLSTIHYIAGVGAGAAGKRLYGEPQREGRKVIFAHIDDLAACLDAYEALKKTAFTGPTPTVGGRKIPPVGGGRAKGA